MGKVNDVNPLDSVWPKWLTDTDQGIAFWRNLCLAVGFQGQRSPFQYGNGGLLAVLGFSIWQLPTLVQRPHVEISLDYLVFFLLLAHLKVKLFSGRGRDEVDVEQRSTMKESAALNRYGALVPTAAAAHRPIHYTQQHSHSRWFCCRSVWALWHV